MILRGTSNFTLSQLLLFIVLITEVRHHYPSTTRLRFEHMLTMNPPLLHFIIRLNCFLLEGPFRSVKRAAGAFVVGALSLFRNLSAINFEETFIYMYAQ